ncbi:hypothetical protein BKA70DRAFT_1267140 [Coprinopsis sp. MPI-PUGE-AT-0042]|nr:hypothetical protein BKA70DRAFT_1267140 [Coprinopsis sp. MPI-PUGE-AT-0042]
MAEYKPSEVDAYGIMLAASYFGGTILACILYGIQVFVVISTVSAFLRRSKQARKGHLCYVVVSCVIFVTFSVNLALDVWSNFRALIAGGPTGQSYLDSFLNDSNGTKAPAIAGDSMIIVTVAGGDILMLWRCLILWDHKKWVVILPSLTYLGAIGSFVTYLVTLRTWPILPSLTAKATVASGALSVATNLLVTLLIMLRLTITRRHTSKAFPDRKTQRMYSDAVGVPVEAAVPLSVFGIFFIIVMALSFWYEPGPNGLLTLGRIGVLTEIFTWVYYSLCALSPQMIVYRVATGRSWKDTAESRDGGAAFSQPIQFARSAKEDHGGDSSTDNV